MNKEFTVALLCALFLALSAAGCADAPKQRVDSGSYDYEPIVAKADWLKNLHGGLTEELCAEDQVFRSCFELSQEDCQQQVQEAATICESEFQPAIPEVVSDTSGLRWGSRIGKCTGENLYRAVSEGREMRQNETCSKLLSEL